MPYELREFTFVRSNSHQTVVSKNTNTNTCILVRTRFKLIAIEIRLNNCIVEGLINEWYISYEYML